MVKDEDIVLSEQEDKDIYSNEGDEELLENDEISSAEAGFMEGYTAKDLIECSLCKNKLDLEKAIVKEVESEELTFCSDKCANLYGKRIHD